MTHTAKTETTKTMQKKNNDKNYHICVNKLRKARGKTYCHQQQNINVHFFSVVCLFRRVEYMLYVH